MNYESLKIEALQKIDVPAGKKVFFASDFHLGIPNYASSVAREKKIVQWLHSIKDQAAHIFLLGDLFDAWMEYGRVVPKGYVRLLGTLALLKDAGVPITVFTGNHDLWMYGYFEQELNIPVIHGPATMRIGKHQFFLAHGDGLGNGDVRYKILKSILRNKAVQWLFRRVHPDTGLGLAQYFSNNGASKRESEKVFYGEDKEYLIQFCKNYIKKDASIDYFIFGHRHYKMSLALNNKSTYINLGDWLSYNSFGVYDGKEMSLEEY
jgi:UDP-2,3-diacylglucosamine hydrolase